MTINQHISNIRELIKQHTTDDSTYSDEFLYNLFNLTVNKLRENHYKDDWSWETYCIPTCIAKDTVCGCITNASCLIIKSKFKVPKPYRNKYNAFFKLYTLDWQRLTRIQPSELRAMMTQDVLKEELLYSIINDYIYIWTGNPKTHLPKALQVSIISEDPLAWADVNTCNNDGDEIDSPCYSILDKDFPVSDDIAIDAYGLVLNMLNITLRLQDDKTNDAKENQSINV